MRIYLIAIILVMGGIANAQSLTSEDWVKIADDKLKNNDISGAIFGYEIATKMDTLNSEAYRKWGSLLAHVGTFESNDEKFTDGIEKFRTAVRLNPSKASNYYEWGNALLKEGRYKDDLDAYKQEILQKFNTAEALSDQVGAYCLASFYSIMKDKKNSLKWLDTTLSKDYTVKDKRINRRLLEHDPNLVNVRQDNKFEKLLDTYFPSPQ